MRLNNKIKDTSVLPLNLTTHLEGEDVKSMTQIKKLEQTDLC